MLRTEDCRKWVRAFRGGELVADSRRTKLVWTNRPYPAYFFPAEDVKRDLVPEGAAIELDDLPGHLAVRWDAMDAWFEEDEQVFVHARDPHARVDVLPSSRHVTVSIDGVRVADSTRPTVLFETGLPPRYYLPLTDVRMDLLRSSETHTDCPYKGTASYWSVEVSPGNLKQDIAWYYRTPVAESLRIAGLVCFYNEKVDIDVDGHREERPVSPFS